MNLNTLKRNIGNKERDTMHNFFLVFPVRDVAKENSPQGIRIPASKYKIYRHCL